MFRPDTLDNEWASKCCEERWLPITSDKSKTNNGPKLAIVCRSLNISHVVISDKVSRRPAAEQAQAIISVWKELHAAWANPEPARYGLQFNDLRTRFVLTRRPFVR